MDNNTEGKLAVLIDADNVPYGSIRAMLEEIAKYGTPTFKRIYGDWTRPNLSGWKNVLLEHAITPIQQYSYTKGKNSTDSALIIDAMDILYTGDVDGFCIISSDSDFTRLATRLREAGKRVYGMGEKKTPTPFIASCNKFIYIEILDQVSKPAEPSRRPERKPRKTRELTVKAPSATDEAPKEEPPKKQSSPVSAVTEDVIKLIHDSINDLAEEDGWVGLAQLGSLLVKKQPDFDPRNYGFRKLIGLIKKIPEIQSEERVTGKNNVAHISVRIP